MPLLFANMFANMPISHLPAPDPPGKTLHTNLYPLSRVLISQGFAFVPFLTVIRDPTSDHSMQGQKL